MSQVARVLALRCRDCGQSLSGGPEDAVLACLACRRAWPVRAAGEEVAPAIALEVQALPPQQRSAAGPLLPFWRFDRLRLGGSVGEPGAGAAPAGPAASGFVLAARVRRFHVYGDPGLEYTRRPPRLEPQAPGDTALPLLPVARTLEDAERVLRVLVARLGGDVEEAQPRGPLTFASARLWCVPLIADGAHVRLPHCAVRFPQELVEGYAARAHRL